MSDGRARVLKTTVFGTLKMELSGLVQSVDCDCLSEVVSGTPQRNSGELRAKSLVQNPQHAGIWYECECSCTMGVLPLCNSQVMTSNAATSLA